MTDPTMDLAVAEDERESAVVAWDVRCCRPMRSRAEELPTRYKAVAAVTVGCGLLALVRWGPGVALALLVVGLGLGVALRLMRTNKR